MALLIDKPAPSSATVPASYWRIASRSDDFDNSTVRVQLYGYWTEADRQARVAPATATSLTFMMPDGVEITRDWLYRQVKLHADFDGAADV